MLNDFFDNEKKGYLWINDNVYICGYIFFLVLSREGCVVCLGLILIFYF